jgi:hypothetical protein
MIRPTRALVTATFSLLSVLSAQTANIKISSLPLSGALDPFGGLLNFGVSAKSFGFYLFCSID